MTKNQGKRPISLVSAHPTGEPSVRKRLSMEKYMNCYQEFELDGQVQDDKRFPVSPCSGCGYQICLQCVRMQHVRDSSYRRNQALATYVSCPTSGCKQRRSFNALQPVLNDLACVFIAKYRRQCTGTRGSLSMKHKNHLASLTLTIANPVDNCPRHEFAMMT